MALATRNEIRDQIREEREYFDSDSDRAISEMADSLTPVYNGDILHQWADLSMDESDRWGEIGVDESATILHRMQIDLHLFYLDAVRELWAEIEEAHTCEKPATVSIESARFTGSAVATCSDCAFVSSLWDCACELEHDCTETN